MTPAPTPQPPDHGAAGFCTDHAQPPDERTETVARDALTEVAYRAWCTARRGKSEAPGEYEALYSRIEAEWMAQVVAAVVAALDDESARLRDEVIRAGQAVARGATTRIEILTADLSAARAALDRVRALADDLDRSVKHGVGKERRRQTLRIADDLRAALDPEEPR